jgi:hypothetical protein
LQRSRQVLFVVSLLAASWLAMMAVHELGHVTGAIATGGTVRRIVLHPLSISRTDVAPNPYPGVVVWSGPVVGCALPTAILAVMPRRRRVAWRMMQFFTGFCLIANGAYLALGAAHRIGDCGEMLRTGTPLAAIVVVGIAAIGSGLTLWHRLGSLREFVRQPRLVTWGMVRVSACVWMALAVVGWLCFPN